MQLIILAAAAIAPMVLASPQAYYGSVHHGRYHHRPHHRASGLRLSTGSGLSTGDASASATETAPYGLGNSTTDPGSIGLATGGTQGLSTTVHHTVFTTVPGPSSSVIESANGQSSVTNVLSSPSASESVTANEAAAATEATCDSGTVTATFNPTYTVTDTPSQASTGGAPAVSSFSATLSGSEGASAVSLSPESEPSILSTVASSPAPTSVSFSSHSEATQAPSSPTSTIHETSTVKSDTAPASPKVVSQSIVPKTTSSADALNTATTTSSSSQSQSSAAVAPTITVASTVSVIPIPSSKPAAGSKRGILASGADQDALVSAFDNSTKITWLCNWYSAPPGNLGSHIDFVPQDYGKESNTAPKYEWTTNAKKAIANGAKHFLGFGEPEAPDTPTMHTNMNPQDAVTLFMSDPQPYAKQGIKVGAPAVLQPDPDLNWLKQFLGLCETAGCQISFIAIHWVWSATPSGRVQDFKDTVNNATAMANGKPVWIDNFQASGTNEEQQQWLSQVLPWLESNDAVERYAYLSPDRSTGTGFLNADGSMSSLGEFYGNF